MSSSSSEAEPSRRGSAPLWAGLFLVGGFLLNGGPSLVGLLVAIGLTALMLGRVETPRVRRWADRVFAALFTAFTLAAGLWLAAGLLPFLARVSSPVEARFVDWGGGVTEAAVTMVGDDVAPGDDVRLEDVSMAFEPPALALRAGSQITLFVTNEHVGAPHNLSLYAEDGSLVHGGSVLAARARSGPTPRTNERFPAPEAGSYELRCDLHPWMVGTVTVAGTPTGPGNWPVVGDVIRRATTAELRTVFHGVTTPSPPVAALEYLFSFVNVGLGIFLVVLRPRDLVARLLALGMVGTGAVFNADAHTALAVVPWIADIHWIGFHGVASFTYLVAIVLFPDGTLRPSWRELPRWRRPIRALYLVGAVGFGLFLFGDTHGLDPVDYIVVYGIGIPTFGLAAQVGKFRHAETDVERRQSRLLATTLLAAVAGAVTYGLLVAALGAGSSGPGSSQLRDLVVHTFPALFAAIPVILVAILVRFRLWDIDRFINRTFVYGGLAGFIGVAYVVVVVLGSEFLVGGRRGNLALSIVATAIVAVAFDPLRERLGRIANRLVYGRRDTPYETLARFSERAVGTDAAEGVLADMARITGEATAAVQATVWVRVGARLERAAVWGGDRGEPASALAVVDEQPVVAEDAHDLLVPVRHQGELLGALTVTKSSGETVTTVEDRLLHDLAGQAGLVLRNARLTEELRARLEELSEQARELRRSRQRIVAAQDAERRRMERDIHDGAQQHLVALAVKFRLARSLVERDPQRARPLLVELHEEANEALETLRNLARGMYPSLLADSGVVTALRSHADRSLQRIEVVDDGLGRYPRDVEAAVYFCCLEAMQNASKHAAASQVTIHLLELDGVIEFTVSDDGVGFDPASSKHGSGLQNLEDRVASLNGSIEVVAAPGRGTTVRGRIPVPQLEPVA